LVLDRCVARVPLPGLLQDELLSDSSITSTSKSPLLGAFAVAVLAAAVLAVLLVLPMPLHGRAFSSLMDLMHAPAFACLTWLTCNAFSKRLPAALWKKLLLVALPLALCGLFAEFIQKFVNRGASWHDARANLLGAFAGVLLHELWISQRTRFRWVLGAAVFGLFALASLGPLAMLFDTWHQQSQFPLMASFENTLETNRFVAQESTIKRVPLNSAETNWGLEIDLHPGLYPGVLLAGMPADWSAYSVLAFDVTVDAGPPLNLILKVHDSEHRQRGFEDDDRFDGQFRLEPGMHHIRIPLTEIQSAPRTRLMDLSDIEGWQLFTYELAEPRTIVLDNLRLE
jgi:hypothetical protein